MYGIIDLIMYLHVLYCNYQSNVLRIIIYIYTYYIYHTWILWDIKSINFHTDDQGASQLMRVSNGHSTPGVMVEIVNVGNLKSKVDVCFASWAPTSYKWVVTGAALSRVIAPVIHL